MPSSRNRKALARPMLTPGMNSGRSMTRRMKRGTPSSRIDMAARSPSNGARMPTRTAIIAEARKAPRTSGVRQSSPYQRSVHWPGSTPWSEATSEGTSGT
jgi:hypothetical protein